jgi:hypothetical protein
MTLSTMTLSIRTLSILGLIATLSKNDTQHNNTKLTQVTLFSLVCDAQFFTLVKSFTVTAQALIIGYSSMGKSGDLDG